MKKIKKKSIEFTPGVNKPEKISIKRKKDASKAIGKGYELTPDLLKKIHKHFPGIIISGTDGIKIMSCKIREIGEDQKIHVESDENSNLKWAFQADQLCNIINQKSAKLEFMR